jgi:hypothetical protein
VAPEVVESCEAPNSVGGALALAILHDTAIFDTRRSVITSVM